MKRYVKGSSQITSSAKYTYDADGLKKAIIKLFDTALEESPFESYTILDINVSKKTRPVYYYVVITYRFNDSTNEYGDSSKLWLMDVPMNQDIPENYYIRTDKYIHELLKDHTTLDAFKHYKQTYQEALSRFIESSEYLASKRGFQISDPSTYPGVENLRYSDFH